MRLAVKFGQTNLLVCRREFLSSLSCLYMCGGILILTLSLVGACKDSRQNRLAIKGQTNLLRRRKLFTSSLLYLTYSNGCVTSNSRLKFQFRLSPARLERNLKTRLNLPCTTYIYVYPFTSYFPVKPVKPFTSTCRHILYLTLSLEAYKESRQKRLVEHREYNLKTAILQYFIDTGATNITRLHSLVGIDLDSLNFKKHVRTYARSTNPVMSTYFPERNLTAKRRCFGRSNNLVRPQRNFTGERRRCCFGQSTNLVVKTSAHLAKLEEENKTQECKIFYVFIISSFQLKSLDRRDWLNIRSII